MAIRERMTEPDIEAQIVTNPPNETVTDAGKIHGNRSCFCKISKVISDLREKGIAPG